MTDLLMTESLHDAQARRRLGILCGTMIAGILGATLWPFNPIPKNEVSWLQGANGISFGKAGIVVGKSPLRVESADGNDACSLELLLRPASTDSSYVILGFYSKNGPQTFLVRQWTDGLLVTHNEDTQHRTVKEKFDVDHSFQPGVLRLVTIVSGPNGSIVYLDGKKAQSFPKFRMSRSDLSGDIVLGSSAVGYEPWRGEISGLAIYARELVPAEVASHHAAWTKLRVQPADLDGTIARYDFSEGSGREIHNELASGPDLEIPEHFSIPHKPMLQSPLKEFSADWWYVYDVLVNIAGFAPLGGLVYTYLRFPYTRRKAILLTILTGAVLSFTIEFLQFYIPRRASGMTDVIMNTLGAALGAMIANTESCRRFLQRMKLIANHDPT
jgi:VanZ family protein